MVVGVLHHLTGQGDVLGKGLGGGVDHHGGEAIVNAALAQLKSVAVVQMQADGQARVDDGGLYQLHQIGAVGIGPGALGHLQNNRGLQVGGGAGDALNDLHVVHIECADGIAALIGLFKHFFRCYQRHSYDLLYIINSEILLFNMLHFLNSFIIYFHTLINGFFTRHFITR